MPSLYFCDCRVKPAVWLASTTASKFAADINFPRWQNAHQKIKNKNPSSVQDSYHSGSSSNYRQLEVHHQNRQGMLTFRNQFSWPAPGCISSRVASSDLYKVSAHMILDLFKYSKHPSTSIQRGLWEGRFGSVTRS